MKYHKSSFLVIKMMIILFMVLILFPFIRYLIHELKDHKKRENPYNRKEFPKSVKKNLVKYLSLCKSLNINVETHDKDENENIDPRKQVDFKALELFQHIDQLGNYTNSQWFLSLD